MFSQSADFSQSSNGDYNFLHNNSQNSSQFEIEGMNKNQNILGVGDLGTINEENPLSPIKINYNNDSKKSLIIANQNVSKSSKYSFGNPNNNNINKINKVEEHSNIPPNIDLKNTQKNKVQNYNKENINNNIVQNKNNDNNNFFQINFDSYKCQLSQQIDQVEKIASQQKNNLDSNINTNNKINRNVENMKNINTSNTIFNNNITEDELLEHQKFNKYCSDLIDNAMNKNLEYIDNIKNNFVNSLDTYKIKFKTNAEIIKKLILLYSDDIFQKERNKVIISNLTDQLLNHINSFFLEMNKFNNFNLNSNNLSNNNINENS